MWKSIIAHLNHTFNINFIPLALLVITKDYYCCLLESCDFIQQLALEQQISAKGESVIARAC